LIYWRARTD